MNLDRMNGGSAAGIGFIMVSVIFAVLAVGVKLSSETPAFDADRGDLRAKALAEMRVAEEKALTTSAVIDSAHGTVRLPIETAMQLAAQAWKNPATARADLNARAENAAKELPKTPPKPSIFE
jgi:hypothetical protein